MTKGDVKTDVGGLQSARNMHLAIIVLFRLCSRQEGSTCQRNCKGRSIMSDQLLTHIMRTLYYEQNAMVVFPAILSLSADYSLLS